jgi:hypothetical protein
MSQFGDRPITNSYCSFWQILHKLVKAIVYLHNVWVLKIVGWEDLQLQLVRDVMASGSALRVFVVVRVVDEVSHNIRLSDVYQKRVSDNDRALQLGERTVSFAQISDLVLSFNWFELDVKLATLVVVASTAHQVVHRRLVVFANVPGHVGVVHWDQEIIHQSLGHLHA